MINFVSNLPRSLRTGGYSARNAAACDVLGRLDELHYAGPIDPRASFVRKVRSKFRRVLGSQGDFFFFSESRLRAIAREVEARCRPDAEFDFFHGFTPWILTEPRRPYVTWNDCTFHDYMNIFHVRARFRDADLRRIETAEARWLKRAEAIIFRSEFFARRAIDHYGLDEARVRSVGNFGEIEMPERDAYAGGREFAFVSTNFEAKGGRIVVAAFREVRKRYPDARLTVVGDRPVFAPREPGLTFTGYLLKEAPAQVEQFRHLLGRARALVHPTQSDTNPAIIVEAGYFGCPAISSRRFAIPEVVDDGVSGLLLDDPRDAGSVAGAMIAMLDRDEDYLRMRRAAWTIAREQHNKAQFEERLVSCMREFGIAALAQTMIPPPRSAPVDGSFVRFAGNSARSAVVINFVSNLPRELRTGGFSAMNAAACAALGKLGELHYAGPIDPRPSLARKVVSKFWRVLGSQGDFIFFSDRRLRTIAREVEVRFRPDARLDFFHGFTPWILTEPRRPYIAWSDCTFHDYMNIYHHRERFRDADLQRIEETEARWLRSAYCAVFTSEWAAARAVARYALDARRVRSVRIFGEIEMPERDVYAGGREFAFVSTNFEAKGGPVVLAAFREVRKHYPDARLTVVGDRPSFARRVPGLTFTGYLRKEVPAEVEQFRQLLGRARVVVHPTQSDIAPLLLIEAAYFGCPAISTRRFAIPELVEDARTGILVDDPGAIQAVADAMKWMLGNEEPYREMRRECWARSRRLHTKKGFEDGLISCIQPAIGNASG